MALPESHARQVLQQYSKDVPGGMAETDVLERLIADEIQKAVSEDREKLRAKMACEVRNPCRFNGVCAHHRALAAAILFAQLYDR